MKSKISFLFLFLIFSSGIFAQSLLDTIRTNIDEKIINLNTSQLSTGILYDRAYPAANLQEYGFLEGTTSGNAYLTDPGHYFKALEELAYSDYLGRYPNIENLYNDNLNTSGVINMGVINADFNVFKENAVHIGALLVQGQDSLFYNNPNSNISPYQTYKNAFISTPLKRIIKSKNVTFNFNGDFWLETAQSDIRKLEVDFDDGDGYVSIKKNNSKTINYNAFGVKTIKVKATFSNGKYRVSESELKVSPNSVLLPSMDETHIETSMSCNFALNDTFNSGSYTFQGYDEQQAHQGKGSYINHSGTSCLTKPVIVVEGYDPEDKNDHNTLLGILNKNQLFNDLYNQNYDILTLNFEPRLIDGKQVKGGTDYIERNAMVLVRFIEMINENKDPNAEPTKIVGFSMGGLVVRYALRYMEIHNIPHDVDLYVSVDAPHQGANVPAGVQHTIKLIDDLVPSWLSEELGNLEDEINHPATKQMLKYHYKGDNFYQTFYNNLNAMGYPQNTRNIAVVNGSLNGSGINPINHKYYEGKAQMLMHLIDGKLRLNFTKNSGAARVFYWRVKLLGVSIHKRQKDINTNAAVGSLENAPAGYVGLDELDEKIMSITNMKLDWLVAGMSQKLTSERFSFIPSKSATDFQGNPYLYQNINANLVCSNNTPFDSYYSSINTNELHMFLSSEASDFIYQEIIGNPQSPSGEFFMPTGSQYYVGVSAYMDLEMANDLPGRNELPHTFPERVTVEHVTPLGASSISWELVEDEDNAVAEWNHSGSYLYFKYYAYKTNATLLFKYSFKDECGVLRNYVYSFSVLPPMSNFNLQEDSFTVYPVPADQELNVGSNLDAEEILKLELYNLNGGKVKENNFEDSQIQWDVSTLNNGLYFLKIISANGEVIKQISIQH